MKQRDFLQKGEILSPEEEAKLRAELAAANEEITRLRQEVSSLKKALYGQKSEKTEYVLEDGEQLCLFNEAECEENRREREAEEAIVVPAYTRKKRRTHDEMAADLPVEEVIETDNFNPEDYPIVDTPITLRIVTQRTVDTDRRSLAEMPYLQELEAKTGIHIEWEEIPIGAWEEKKNLMFVSGDLPDAFPGEGISDLDILSSMEASSP